MTLRYSSLRQQKNHYPAVSVSQESEQSLGPLDLLQVTIKLTVGCSLL